MQKRIVAGCIAILSALLAPAWGATLLSTTELVADTAQADANLPSPITFEIATEGAYTLTLRDLNAPALFASLEAIVTRDLTVVSQMELSYQDASDPDAPLSTSMTFSAPPGDYRILILGVPRPSEAGGTFGVTVAPASGGTSLVEAVEVVPADSSMPPSSLQSSFDIDEPGTYELAFADHAFPAALNQVDVLLLRHTNGAPVEVTRSFGTFAAQAGRHELLVIADPAQAEQAGLYSVRVTGGPSSQTVYESTSPVGMLGPAKPLQFSTAGEYELRLSDRQFPLPLDSALAAVVQGGALLREIRDFGATTLNASEGVAQLFSLAAGPDGGVYGVRIAQGSRVAYSDVHVVAPTAPATTSIYALASNAPAPSGNYLLRVHDFVYPSAFSALDTAVAQGDAILDRLDEPGEDNVILSSGLVTLLVAARTSGPEQNGLFAVRLASTTSAAVVIEATQGVGGLFRSHAIEVTSAGEYDISLADLGFPATLSSSALAVTKGMELFGEILGSGTIPREPLEAGTYVLSFVGQPGESQAVGAYGVSVVGSVTAPTVTFTATPTSVTSGQRSMLQWSTTNATSCTASGAWSGNKDASGSEQTSVLNASSTFEISCTGPGGSASATARVTVSAPAASGGRRGGGGAADPLSLLIYICVGLCAALRWRHAGRRW